MVPIKMNFLRNFLNSQKAVSEIIDFVTILGILVLSISVIGVAGYPMLKNTQDAKHLENTRESFTVLAENINKVVLGQSLSQSVELKMYGGMLSVLPSSVRESTINITLNNTSHVIFSETYRLGVIEAKYDAAAIGYENTGAWINYTSGATIMVSKPIFVISNNTIFIPVTTIIGSSSTGGSGLVRVVAEEIWSELNHTSDVKSIRIIVNSSYTGGWQEKFFKETNSWAALPGEQIMEKTFDAPVDVYIQQKAIYVQIES